MNTYKIQRFLGKGQYGTAHVVTSLKNGGTYCLKRITMPNKDDYAAALKEVEVLRQLHHDNIISYEDHFFDDEGSLCIVTCLCEEGELAVRIKERKQMGTAFSENEVMDMFTQIASALNYIHGKRIVHRDLKTQNIFIAKGGIIKLGDFGIAKVMELTSDMATTVTGTPFFMAPEVCLGKPYAHKSDIWSLGCVLYELCTLEHAFSGDNLLALVYQIVHGGSPAIPAGSGYSQQLVQLVGSMMQREPDARPGLPQILQQQYVQRHTWRFIDEQRQQVLASTSSDQRAQREVSRSLSKLASSKVLQGGSTRARTLPTSPSGRARSDPRQQQQQQQQQLQPSGLVVQALSISTRRPSSSQYTGLTSPTPSQASRATTPTAAPAVSPAITPRLASLDCNHASSCHSPSRPHSGCRPAPCNLLITGSHSAPSSRSPSRSTSVQLEHADLSLAELARQSSAGGCRTPSHSAVSISRRTSTGPVIMNGGQLGGMHSASNLGGASAAAGVSGVSPTLRRGSSVASGLHVAGAAVGRVAEQEGVWVGASALSSPGPAATGDVAVEPFSRGVVNVGGFNFGAAAASSEAEVQEPKGVVNFGGFNFGAPASAATCAAEADDDPFDLPPIISSPTGPQRGGSNAKLKFGVATDSKPDGAFIAVLKATTNDDEVAAEPEYEDDFEEYVEREEEQQEQQQQLSEEVVQRLSMMSSVLQMARSYQQQGSDQDLSDATQQELGHLQLDSCTQEEEALTPGAVVHVAVAPAPRKLHSSHKPAAAAAAAQAAVPIKLSTLELRPPSAAARQAGHLSMMCDGSGGDRELEDESPAEVVARLRQESLELLGPVFNKVYSYLRDVRHNGTGSVSSPAVQARLLQLLGRQKDLLDGCERCEMLVDYEMMH